MTKREGQQRELKKVMEKEIGAKNPIFSSQHIYQLHDLFCLYADPRQHRADVNEFLFTAQNLGLDSTYKLVFRLFNEINEESAGNALDFEQFLVALTNRVGNPNTEEGRHQHFKLLDFKNSDELDLDTLRTINEELNYGYNDEALVDIIQSIGGHTCESITFEQFDRFISRRNNSRAKNA